jgi:hypothetical protein
MKRIIYQNSEGSVSVIIPTESVELALKDVPEGVAYEIVEDDAIPADRTFRGAWVANGAAVEVDLDKAKDIGHDIRRSQRAEEFKPFDEIIAKQIPGADATEAEANRQVIRDKYAQVRLTPKKSKLPLEVHHESTQIERQHIRERDLGCSGSKR